MQIVQEIAPVGRVWRRPKHSFNIKSRPFQIQPFFIAPVLPGETMKNLLIQSRVVSDPIRHPLVGWWKEYYFFYVKHRDLDARDKLVAMMLNPQEDMTSLNSAAAVVHNHVGGINWSALCLKRVVEEFFRDEGEAWDNALLDGLPLAHAFSKDENWLDSLTLDAAMPDIDPNDASAQAYDPQYAQWEFMRAQKLIQMTYEDWLRTFGIRNVPVEHNKPELVRYLREWTYPSNTVDPLTGTPSSALSWSIAERADKDRFFKEPGFLYGVTVTRPKLYLGKLKGSLADWLNDAMSWLPAMMRDEPYTSLKQFATASGPLSQITDAGGYWLDMRDLFLYGDQFANYDLSTSTDGNVALGLPATATGAWQHIPSADIDTMFKAPASNKIREDGIVSLAILGSQREQT